MLSHSLLRDLPFQITPAFFTFLIPLYDEQENYDFWQCRARYPRPDGIIIPTLTIIPQNVIILVNIIT